jgi:MFS family permease
MNSASLARALGVTLFLGLLGGIAGAVGGTLIVGGILLATHLPTEFGSVRFVFGVASAVGCVFGVMVGPVLAWLFLRHVPIWRAIAETAVAAGIVATVSLTFGSSLWAMVGWSLAGASLAAIRLRRAFPRSKSI